VRQRIERGFGRGAFAVVGEQIVSACMPRWYRIAPRACIASALTARSLSLSAVISASPTLDSIGSSFARLANTRPRTRTAA